MRVYFNASIAGKDKHIKEFEAITKTAEDLGCTVYKDHVLKRDASRVNNQTRLQHEKDFRKARERIQNSDVMIVEASYPSIGVGYTMTIALEMNKPILVLYKNDPHGLLVGDPNRLLKLKKYDLKNKVGLKKAIYHFLENSKKRILNIRFNLMIDENEENYLEWISKKMNISKANYIRNLIDEEMRNKMEYKST